MEYDLLARLLAVTDECVAPFTFCLRRKVVDPSRSCCAPTSTVISFILPVQLHVKGLFPAIELGSFR